MRRLVTGLGMPHPIVALFHRPARPPAGELLARCERLVIVEGVDNPANVGAIVRNAAAFGWDGLLLDHTSADPLARRALRVAMGTAFTLPHARTRQLVDELGDADGLDAVRADARSRRRPTSGRSTRPGAAAVVIGSERAGLSAEMLAICDAGADPDGDRRRLAQRRRRCRDRLLRARLTRDRRRRRRRVARRRLPAEVLDRHDRAGDTPQRDVRELAPVERRCRRRAG